MNHTLRLGFILWMLSAWELLAAPSAPEQWRSEHRVIDMHQHINYTTQNLARAIKIMDAAGLGVGVNLSGGVVTRKGDAPSPFEVNKALADRLYPGRFVHYMNLDYAGYNEPDFAEKAAQQIEEGKRLGAAGLKEYKRLGLYLRDKDGKLLKVDDPKLDLAWERCGAIGMPVSIHIGDPKAFWLPYDSSNERWTELKDHRSWWFGDRNIYPPRMELLAALGRVLARHPKTTFLGVHFANNPEDVEAVDAWLDKYPNALADVAARVPELGRQDPEKVRNVFIKHQDRILFGTDFMVVDRLILGSGGSGPGPNDEEAVTFYQKHWRWFETRDKDFAHMTPIQGDWKISAIGLPEDVLRKIYFDNARKLLRRSLPAPRAQSKRAEVDFALDGDLTKPVWQKARAVQIDQESMSAKPRPEVATVVRALWTQNYLYLGYECPFTSLTVFERSPVEKERLGLWDRDVVEAFLGSDSPDDKRYFEFEVAPTAEKLDVAVNLPDKDFSWDSRFEAATKVDRASGRWFAEVRIPLACFPWETPKAGTRWRLNLYRCDRASGGFLAWNPTLRGTFHAPDRFGVLEFVE